MACTAHNRLLKRGRFMPCELSFGHELEPPEGNHFNPIVNDWILPATWRNVWWDKLCLQKRSLSQKPKTECLRTRIHHHWPSGRRIKYWCFHVDRFGVAHLASSQGGQTRTKHKTEADIPKGVVRIVVMGRLLRVAPEYLRPLSENEDRHTTFQRKQSIDTERCSEVVESPTPREAHSWMSDNNNGFMMNMFHPAQPSVPAL